MQGKPGSLEITLLENGLDFIWSALDYLQTDTEDKHLKYAILHLSAGVELILKERLRCEHWSLLFENTDRADKKAYEAGDFSSVSFAGCMKRLTGVCGIAMTDKQQKDLLALRDKRNRLEHFGIIDSIEALTATATKVLEFIMDFLATALDPLSLDSASSALLADIRKKLGQLELFVDTRWNAIKGEINSSDHPIVSCPMCGQEAGMVIEGVRCLFCGYQAPEHNAAVEYITYVLREDHYTCVKDGGEWPLFSCPECGTETLVDTRRRGPADRYVCFSCGTGGSENDFHWCESCGQIYLNRNEDLGICRDCFSAKVNDDD